MSYSNISDVLLEFNNKDASNQKSALALSNTSELEIKNLLKQVDTMIHHKKLRWERQKQELDNKLNLREQEFENQKTTLEQKSNEVESLKKLLDKMEMSTQEIMKKYENEINILNDQLNKLKSDYIKMQKKIKKSSSATTTTTTTKKSVSEPDTPNKPSRDSSRDANNHIFRKTSQPPNQNRNNVFINSNLSAANSSSITSSASSSSILSSFNNNNNKHFTNDHRLDKLNSKLEENKLKNNEFYQEKERLNKSLEHYKRINKELIKKIDELTLAKEQNEINSNELKTSKLNSEYYKQEIRKRDDYIKDLEALDKADNIELQFYKDEVKKLKKQEITIKNQFDKMKTDNEEAIKQMQQIENENKKLKNKVLQLEEKMKTDETKLKMYEKEREYHLEEMSLLKNELAAYSSQLNDKNNQLKNLIDKSNKLEQQLKDKDDQFSKTNQELIMTIAHVEALRLENHFLRQSLDEKKSDEKEIVEMQKKYHHVIDLTEKENKRLKNEIVSLSECVESLKSKANTPSKLAMNKNNQMNTEFENRRNKLQKEEFEKQIDSLKKQHEFSVKRLNNEIEKLYSEKHLLMAELDNNNNNNNNNRQFNFSNTNNLAKPNRSSSSMDSITGGALSVSTNHTNNEENIINMRSKSIRQFKPLEQEHSLTRNNSSSNTSNAKFNTDFEPIFDNSPAKSSRLSIASQLRMEEFKRKKDLENMLDIHIDSLRRSNAHENAINNFI